MIRLGVYGQPCASMSALFHFEKEVENNEMADSCRRDTCASACLGAVLLYCGRGERGQDFRRIGMERQAGCRREKRIGRSMRRINQRTAFPVISGTGGNRNAQRTDAIIF